MVLWKVSILNNLLTFKTFIMVIIQDYAVRTSEKGEQFVALIVSGGLEMVKSQTTGRFYATTRKTSIPSTLDERTAKLMVGQKMKGDIVKVKCDPYTFTTDDGEDIELDFKYEYEDVSDNVEENVFEEKIEPHE